MVFRTRVVTIGGRELVRIGAFPFEQTFLRLRLMILWPREFVNEATLLRKHSGNTAALNMELPSLDAVFIEDDRRHGLDTFNRVRLSHMHTAGNAFSLFTSIVFAVSAAYLPFARRLGTRTGLLVP